MFEIHGWAAISSDTYTIGDKADAHILAELREQIARLSAEPGIVAIHLDPFLNGLLSTLTVTGLRNHRDERLLGLFRWIAEHSAGSYGMVWVSDDEKDPEYEFRVWRLARGKLEE